MIADWVGNLAAPQEDWLLIETGYDRVGWQPKMPDLTSKGIWETAKLEESTRDMEGQMIAHCIDLRAVTPAFTNFVASASVTKIVKDSIRFPQGFESPKSMASMCGTFVEPVLID